MSLGCVSGWGFQVTPIKILLNLIYFGFCHSCALSKRTPTAQFLVQGSGTTEFNRHFSVVLKANRWSSGKGIVLRLLAPNDNRGFFSWGHMWVAPELWHPQSQYLGQSRRGRIRWKNRGSSSPRVEKLKCKVGRAWSGLNVRWAELSFLTSSPVLCHTTSLWKCKERQSWSRVASSAAINASRLQNSVQDSASP